MKRYDITLLTCRELLQPDSTHPYNQNVLQEEQLLTEALHAHGLAVHRTHWDDPDFDWGSTGVALFRTTWDYFYRAAEFKQWLEEAGQHTRFINPIETIRWNLDKHYLQDLTRKGVNVVPTIFIEPGESQTLQEITGLTNWEEFILKPAISGAARHTYHFTLANAEKIEPTYKELISQEALMLQPFLQNIVTRGEVSHMVFNGKYSHSVLKRAKEGDFRVQDDHGGTVHDYSANEMEIALAEAAAMAIEPTPVYARIDMTWDENNEPVLIELELIEPELWMRKHPVSAKVFAREIYTLLN